MSRESTYAVSQRLQSDKQKCGGCGHLRWWHNKNTGFCEHAQCVVDERNASSGVTVTVVMDSKCKGFQYVGD
jgi:hypothetical protein